MEVQSGIFHHDETIKHLFSHCKFTRLIWLDIQIAFNLYPPRGVAKNIYKLYVVNFPFNIERHSISL
jgi:hypothetical protein